MLFFRHSKRPWSIYFQKILTKFWLLLMRNVQSTICANVFAPFLSSKCCVIWIGSKNIDTYCALYIFHQKQPKFAQYLLKIYGSWTLGMPKKQHKSFLCVFMCQKWCLNQRSEESDTLFDPAKNTLKKRPEGCFYTKCVPDVYILSEH